jgi:hypothetical protein
MRCCRRDPTCRLPLLLLAWLAALLLLAPLASARAGQHALLVGVSRYAVFAGDERWQLAGPANDVQLMRELLARRGFAGTALRVLADGVPGADAPTRDAILGALDGLAARVAPGDQVLLYFAGHGSQMPADPQTPQGRAESDGLHEIFLPADVGRWNPATRRVDRAIADHELVERLDALTGRGAFVFAVFDTCHSATSLRAVPGAATRWRRVDPAVLGIPGARSTPAAPALPGLVRMATAKAGTGGFVAFYAAQTTELTPEMPLPAGPGGTVHGLFTYTLAEALSAAPSASYRQLAQHVLARYAAQNLTLPTPLFTGTALDAPVLGGATAAALRQWPLQHSAEGLHIDAGRLDGLDVGVELDLLPDPLAAPGTRLGRVRVVRAAATRAWLSPPEAAGASAPELERLPPQAVARRTGAPRIALQLRVAAPPRAGDADGHAVQRAIDALGGRPAGLDIAWVRPDEAHDLSLQVALGRLWLLPPSTQWQTEGSGATPSLAIDQTTLPLQLQAQLERLGRSLNLLRIAAATQVTAAEPMLQPQASLTPVQGPARSLDEWHTADAREGDLLAIELRNAGRRAVDLTALYVDADHGITLLYPLPAGASNRIEAGDRERIAARIDATTRGLERLLLIAVEAQPQGERSDFSALAQPRLGEARGAGDAMARLVRLATQGAAAGPAARGSGDLPATEGLELRVYNLQVR